MPKNKKQVNLRYTILHWFTYHPWLKLIALGLAILVWLYINSEISKFKFSQELWRN